MDRDAGQVTEAMLEAAVNAAMKADIIPLEGGGEGVRLEDYLEYPTPGAAIELGVTLTEKDKDGLPRFHWYSDIRGEELEDFRRAILKPIVRAALTAAIAEQAAHSTTPGGSTS